MMEYVTIIKLTVVDICLLLTSTMFVVITLYKWSVFLASEGMEFHMAHTAQDGITFRIPFPSLLQIHQV